MKPTRTILDHSRKPTKHDVRSDCDTVGTQGQSQLQVIFKPSPAPQTRQIGTAMTTIFVLNLYQCISSHSTCTCHERYSESSPRLTNKLIGTYSLDFLISHIRLAITFTEAVEDLVQAHNSLFCRPTCFRFHSSRGQSPYPSKNASENLVPASGSSTV